jgi:hypothetical protein
MRTRGSFKRFGEQGGSVDSRPSDEEIATWQRWFAIECNNRAWKLAEATNRAPDDTQVMVNAAHAAAYHWSQVGTPLNAARARMLLGYVHALIGSGPLALDHARASLAYFTAHQSPDWEIAFAHAVMASAARAAGEPALHAHHHREAARLGNAIAGAEDREIFMRTFRQIPEP